MRRNEGGKTCLNERLSDVDDNWFLHIRRPADDDYDEEETVNTFGCIWKNRYKGQRVNQVRRRRSAVGSVCFSLRGHFGAASFLTPSSPLSSSPQSFALGLAGTYLSPFLFLLFYDISRTLMTQTTVTSLITTRHTPTLT